MSKVAKKLSLLLVVALIVIVVFGVLPSTAFAKAAEQYIKFEYLKRIENTPFAEKIQTIIRVPVYDNHTIMLADVKSALNCKQFGVMQSYCNTFEYDNETNTYKAVYYKSVYLNAKTVDGNSLNYYLDCNLSFADYFGGFVDNDIVDSDLYEYYLNRLHVTYGELDGYEANNIYGYWGVVVIPHGNDFNQLWADMFGNTTTYSGVLEKFTYSRNLQVSEYNKLLEDYQYGWLEIVWKDIVGLFTGGSYMADYFMIYCDSQTTEAFIAENGADDIDDDSGAIFNGLEDGYEYVRDKLSEFFSNDKNVWKVVGVFGGLILLTVLIIVIIVLVKSLVKDTAKQAVKKYKKK